MGGDKVAGGASARSRLAGMANIAAPTNTKVGSSHTSTNMATKIMKALPH
jgi:hypothetical protein